MNNNKMKLSRGSPYRTTREILSNIKQNGLQEPTTESSVNPPSNCGDKCNERNKLSLSGIIPKSLDYSKSFMK